MNPEISIPIARLSEHCRTNGIKRLDLFGSALRADFGPESDMISWCSSSRIGSSVSSILSASSRSFPRSSAGRWI